MLKEFPGELIYAIIALAGGMARYLNSYAGGSVSFRLSIFLASSVASAFSGYMFALLGLSMNLPPPMIYMMAGTGGFFGDQVMKLLFDYLKNKAK